ncbi:WXG100 family type VII secretion target [Nocardia sp. CDC160]|uniref:WXG100 family type VII secretion target n=1 Tax=Nocardia sp. CDC160 TaxID=3112166 RepID=UPI002DBA1D8E|nr:WXG100 family type VII secretion target [Nocardia sp. CDC160]MEC3913287.1 WXG100 family type VII secretion target [Nocardia sp. CDC160]
MVANEAEVAKAAQSHMADVVASIKDILKKITDTVDSSKSGFAGDAANSFQAAAKAWDDESVALNKALDDFQDKVGAGTDVFSNVDISNQDEFSKALTNLG